MLRIGAWLLEISLTRRYDKLIVFEVVYVLDTATVDKGILLTNWMANYKTLSNTKSIRIV